jgi:cytoskeletal protein CcmA (bactofilin family)
MGKSGEQIQTFLGPETRIEGKLAVHGMVRVDGHF